MAQSAGSILEERPKPLPVTVQKPTPYTFDLGLLLANDPNPLLLSPNAEESLSATARDGAQALLNQLLTTCPISSTEAGVLLSLPPITTALPREKVCVSRTIRRHFSCTAR
jgi:regulator of ribosome biosynthesis